MYLLVSLFILLAWSNFLFYKARPRPTSGLSYRGRDIWRNMSIVSTILIAIAALVIGFIIGFCVGFTGVPAEWKPDIKSNPVQPFNAEPSIPVVTSKVVLPKRISKAEYAKRVNTCLKDVVTKAVNAYVSVSDKTEKQRIIKGMFDEWKAKLRDVIAYDKYNPDFQRLDIICHKNKSDSIVFDAAWSLKQPYDCLSYVRRHNKSSKR